MTSDIRSDEVIVRVFARKKQEDTPIVMDRDFARKAKDSDGISISQIRLVQPYSRIYEGWNPGQLLGLWQSTPRLLAEYFQCIATPMDNKPDHVSLRCKQCQLVEGGQCAPADGSKCALFAEHESSRLVELRHLFTLFEIADKRG